MIILDENIIDTPRTQLINWRISVRQIGFEVGRKGLQDINEIIPLLHSLGRPTFFTRDREFYDSKLCHKKYCIVYLKMHDYEVAEYIRRFLHHPESKTHAKRKGCVVRLSSTGVHCWRINVDNEEFYNWV